MSASLEIGLLGPLVVRRGGAELPIAAPKQRALLALLALEVGRVVSSDALADRLWAGDPPASAVTALQVYVSQLRKLLGGDVIATCRPGYVLDLPEEAVDVTQFERLVADGRALLAGGDARLAEAVLGEALSLWRGGALAEFVYEEWGSAPARRLEELRLVAWEDRLDARLQLGQGAELASELEGLVREHPLRERLRGQQMLALYRAGRQADALTAFREARAALVDGLGIDPSPALVALERRILQHDASLEVPAEPAAASSWDAARRVGTVGRTAPVAAPPDPALCLQCGAEVSPAAKFCAECGASLGAAPRVEREERKLVTALFCDVVGSTALAERLDAEVVRALMRRYFDVVSAMISRHGGAVEKFIGDAVVAVFGVPAIHEDDALRAVRAACDIRTAVETLGDEAESRWGVQIRTRIGVSSGEVIVGTSGSEGSLVGGGVMNLAARLEQAADAEQIFIADSTFELVRDAVVTERLDPVPVRGRDEPVLAYRLLEVRAGAEGHTRRMDLPLIGREGELRLIRDSYQRCVSERACGLVTVLGTAGVGKSRLVSEALQELGGEPLVISGRCLPYGSGITYWPLAEAVRQLTAVDEAATPQDVRRRLGEWLEHSPNAGPVAEGVCGLLGLPGVDADVDQSAWALTEVLTYAAQQRPVVLVLDDVQWAEPPLLDLVDALSERLVGAPVIVLCMARPDLLDVRPNWGGGKLNATTVLLEPLVAAESGELVRQLLGQAPAAPTLVDHIGTTSGGNPLYAEELVAFLRERGDIFVAPDGSMMMPAPTSVVLPPTIRALISARLDQLSEDERGLLESGAVEGETFHLGGVRATRGTPTDENELNRLIRKQLIGPAMAQLPGERALRFRHLLLREAAYDGIPKRQRARLHQRFAEWFEAAVGERVSEFDAILAYHYASAARYLRQLGAEGADAPRNRAVELMRANADRGLSRRDPDAQLMLSGIIELLPSSHPARVEAMADQAVLFTYDEQTADSRAALRSAVAEAARAPRHAQIYVHAQALFAAGLLGVTDDRTYQQRIAEARSLAAEAEASGWHRAAAKAWIAAIDPAFAILRADAAMDAAQRAAKNAQLGGFDVPGDVVLAHLAALSLGSVPIQRAVEACRAAVDETAASPHLLNMRDSTVGVLLARTGRVEEAGALFDICDQRVVEFQIRQGPIVYRRGLALLDAGRQLDAVTPLQESTSVDAATGHLAHGSTAAAMTAHALAECGRPDEASAYVDRARAWAMPDDAITNVVWRSASARISLLAGDTAGAQTLAEEATEMSRDTDFAMDRARTLITHAWVLTCMGKRSHGRTIAREAIAALRTLGAGPRLMEAQALVMSRPRQITPR